MPTDVIMPQMGESIFEGTITKWLKEIGDAVQKDEPLFEISTDKVDAEIPAPEAGVLKEIRFAEGHTVQVNTVVAVIDGAGIQNQPQSAAAPDAGFAEPGLGPPVPDRSKPPRVDLSVTDLGEGVFEGTLTRWLKPVRAAVQQGEQVCEVSTSKGIVGIPAPLNGILMEVFVSEGAKVEMYAVIGSIGSGIEIPIIYPSGTAAPLVEKSAPRQAAAAPEVAAPPQPLGRIRSSPLARRMAKEHGLDLGQIAGTGSEGRIGKEDVLRVLSGPASTATVAQKSAAPQAPPPQRPLPQIPGELVPLTRMRSIIAERMVESMRISPHVHTAYKIDMTRIARLRERQKAAFEQRHRVKLTWMPFIAAAAIEALKRFPVVNASLENTAKGLAIRYHQNVNLGIAVALDWGLIVPVVRQAEQRSFADLARTIADLAERARIKKLSPEEVGGSTFTLTNSGIFGDEFSTPIINQPESAILGISGLKKEAVVLTDAEGNDTIAIRSMQHFTLGFDHRLIDGADACKFMVELKRVLESWEQELGC